MQFFTSRAFRAFGPSGYLTIIGMIRAGFRDIQWMLEELIAEGDKVAARFTMRGAHKGPFFGVPPSGKNRGQGHEFLSYIGAKRTFAKRRGQLGGRTNRRHSA
jgi:predicted ester cyclase